jgi:hypothetical protein
MTMRLAGHGISVGLPRGWEARIYRRPEGLPILHTATFPLPPHDGDFGSGAIASMRPGDVFCALLEYDRDLAGTGLFAPPGLPLPVRAADASPAALQRMLPGRAGLQRFFTHAGRPFCLYVVVRSGKGGPIDVANEVLASVTIDPR